MDTALDPASDGDEPRPAEPAKGAFEETGPGPSPDETNAMVWATIDENSQRRRFPGARALAAFVRDAAHPYLTPKGDERTNIIDQGERTTYALGRDAQTQLFAALEACRLEGSVTHFSERQGTPATPRTGVMLDFDIVTAQRRPALADRHYYRLAGALAAVLQREIDFGAAEYKMHVFFIVKPSASPIVGDGADGPAAAPLYKYGIHVLVPGVRLPRAYKKWLLRSFKSDAAVVATMQDLGAVGDPVGCLDQNSASVPVLFFGSCKRGGTPYVLGAALELTLDLGGGAAWVPPPVVRKLGPADLEGYNLVAELSLVVEAEYDDGRPPLVRKADRDCRPELADRVRDWGERTAGGATPAEELLLAEHSLSTLTLHNAEARHLHALLDLLTEEYSSSRDKWRDVIFALANTSDQYKPLAIWFSHRCPRKWADGGLDALDALWDEALARRGAAERPLTLASITYWARTCNPAKFAEVMERSYFTMLTTYVYDHGGKLEHYMVAKVLHAMLGTKFCVDIDAGPRGAQAYCWYEFVLPGQPQRVGEVWKWRREMEPDDIQVFLSEKLTKVLDQIGEHIDERRLAAREESEAKYYQQLGKTFATTKKSFYNDTFKSGVIRQSTFLFRRRGFAEQLDRIPYLFGTQNGVLKLGRQIELINHYHEYPISRFSPVLWKPFDPADPWTKIVLDAIADIIVEPDARDWILFHAAQGLSGDPKEGLLLLWEGGGQNGKTAFLRWVAKALGPYADKFNVQLLSSEREEADRPNSAIMKFKHLNYAYCEETKKAQVLNDARMKELVNPGDVSGRDLNSKQETFAMRSNFVVASQFSFIVETTDHGTWRRIRHYTAKTKFRKNPDPANPFEKKEDQRFVLQYPNDPQFVSSTLSILCHYYQRLATEYGGQLKNVPAPTIDCETEAFRVSQDALHRWICETIVVSPACGTDYPLGILGGYFSEWYNKHVDRKRHVAGDVIKTIESSALSKFLAPAPNRTLVLRGCRALMADEMGLRPGEEYFSDVEIRAGRSRDEWADALAESKQISQRCRADGRSWWEARDPAAIAAARAAVIPGTGITADEFADAGRRDDAALQRAADSRAVAAPELTEGDIARLLERETAVPPSLDDLYDVTPPLE
jgi:phage/plasmid-associated DNA primase